MDKSLNSHAFIFPHLKLVLIAEFGSSGGFIYLHVMKKNRNNHELQTRREFFKKAAKGTLPILGFMAFGPIVLSSCGDDDDNNVSISSQPSGGDGSWQNPYTPSEALKVANKLKEGETTDEIIIKGRVSSIKLNFETKYGNASFSLKDIGKNSEELQVYRIYYLFNNKYSYGPLLAIGDEVLVVGKLRLYKDVPELFGGYLYSLNGITDPSSACTDCSAACASNCSTECTSSCTGGCSTSCTGGCDTSCTGTCSNGCSTTCTGGCDTTCTGGCKTTCTGGCDGTSKGQCDSCTKSCMQYCGYGCKNTCSGECDSTCDVSCGGMCQTNCSHVGYGSYDCYICSGTCSNTCGTACTVNCSGSCKLTCKGTSS